MERLDTDAKVVGAKQVKRSLSTDNVKLVYVAKDAEKKVTQDIIDLCKEKDVEIMYVDSMKRLGEACKIDINAATAALLK